MKPLDQYETPLTDEMESIYRYPEYHEGATKYVDREKCRSLERRLAACREALEGLLQDNIDRAWGITGSESTAMQNARETLTLTKP